ncbi:hypothetical protein HanRHA438_Chr02g0082761 [Helianthus annuus]|nr:hypothetical protein HanRHA438_Chr02g0082761 [Helianthus annuus]
MLSIIGNPSINDNEDRRSWSLDDSGSFSAKSVKVKLQHFRYSTPDFVIKWNNWAPNKVGILVWWAGMDRILVCVRCVMILLIFLAHFYALVKF